MQYIYIVECSDGTYYTGYTTNIERRVAAHNAKKGAKYTRCRTPVQLIYQEIFANKREAMQREYAIKKMTRVQKEELMGIFPKKENNNKNENNNKKEPRE